MLKCLKAYYQVAINKYFDSTFQDIIDFKENWSEHTRKITHMFEKHLQNILFFINQSYLYIGSCVENIYCIIYNVLQYI